MDEILDGLQMVVDGVMGMGAELGPTGGILAAIALTAILVWITGRFLRL
ncbi:MAG TPA: hypothetical protein VHY10_17455 [Xanthobacteraceae bacterium]|jgi:hypothetical protein|nr:hypothetical protein [Xanthobacteraceae bacterium]